MCGFAGIYRYDAEPIDPASLERMKRATHHRGPDDSGIYHDRDVALIHNRLSILDLSPAGHQPMHDPATGHWIAYNGEVYNFPEIRRKLESLGCRFRSTGDTEVLLYAYRQWGEDFLDRLNGMFAFAIFNERTRQLFLARDRLGIKPLYYYRDARQLVFASEIKSILLADGVERRLRRDAIPELVAFRYLAGDQTLLENVHALSPGHCATIAPNGSSSAQSFVLRRYWDIAGTSDDRVPDEDALANLDDRLKAAVKMQLIADVPVGCALSGGIDSSLVTALACETSTAQMKTFSIGFDAPESDERRHAKAVADKLGVPNFAQVLTADEFWERLPRLIWHLDEPMNHPNSVGIWLLARLARQQVVVLLSGEGGDELLGGYSCYRTVLKLRSLARRFPFAAKLAKLLPGGMSGAKGTVARELPKDDEGRMIWSSAYMPSHFVARLLGRGAIARAEQYRRTLFAEAPATDLVNRHLYYELKTYLVSLLVRVDKMCMAHSLENRVPLLDHTVVEYAFRMPHALKTDEREGKKGLKRLAERRLGHDLFKRDKVGFGVPRSFFESRGMDRLRELVTSRSFQQRELVSPKAVDRILRAHASGRTLSHDAVWILATFELWARTFLDRRAEPLSL